MVVVLWKFELGLYWHYSSDLITRPFRLVTLPAYGGSGSCHWPPPPHSLPESVCRVLMGGSCVPSWLGDPDGFFPLTFMQPRSLWAEFTMDPRGGWWWWW